MKTICTSFLVTALALSAAAQDSRQYSIPKSNPFNPLSQYRSVQVPEPSFQNTPRLQQLIKGNRLELSLNDAISLALENNLDLAIARYNLSIADTDIMRSKSGSSIRGVATGLVQGTPGGGIGGFGSGAPSGAGGTSSGAGGAGSGAGGLVQSTVGAGAPVETYDPQLIGNLSIEHSVQPLSNTVTTGTNQFQLNSGSGSFQYAQAWATGTSMTVGFNGERSTSNSLFDDLTPLLNSSLRVSFRQRLLSGAGLNSNMRFIYIAKNNREISDIAFRNQVIATVSQIQNIYWDLVNAYEEAQVKQRSLDLANKTLSDNREQVRIGALPAIEVTRAETEVATRNEELIQAQTQLQLQQLLMKNAVTRDLGDATVSDAEIIPSDTMKIPENDKVVPVQDLISEALGNRPELAQARIDLTNRQISRKAASNALLPQVDLLGWYGGSGLAGLQNPANTNNAPGTIAPTGFGTAISNLFHNDFPDYGVGLSLNIPLRNRAAKADQIRSELEYRQAQMRLKQLQNQISIEVRNAQFAVQQNRARVETARRSRDLAARTFDIEQKKHLLGASTSNDVLNAQRDLAVAESKLVASMSDYMKSVVELDRSTGNTLSDLGIQIADAENGKVEKEPVVRGVIRREDTQNANPQPRNIQ